MQKLDTKTTDQKLKTILIFLVCGFGFIFLVFGFLWYLGLFPVASINGDWLLRRNLIKSIGAIERLKRTSPHVDLPSPTGTSTLSALSTGNIERGTLEELIHEEIIAQELKRVDSSQDWEERIARDVAGLISGRDQTVLRQATRELYGLDLDDFKHLVLAPQIREEFLRKELALRAEDPEAWLAFAFKNASVKIYFLDYEWREGILIER